MKAVLQRVTSASVTVNGEVVSRIGRGVLCLIGIGTQDTEWESQWLASKILAMKLFPEDKDGETWGWKNSVVDAGYEVLCVSQFTLQANLRKGAKPDFHGAMGSETSKVFYEAFLADLRQKYQADKIFDGKFGAMMDVQLVNDGPVTLILDSRDDCPARPAPKAVVTPEQKQKAKEKAERRAAQQKAAKESRTQADAQTPAAAVEAVLDGRGPTKEEESLLVEKAADRKEEELISQAEKAANDLAERFKVTLVHGI
ncbi:hypothetical protein JCM10213_000053 [Rhodosporidiobolus nylandii]